MQENISDNNGLGYMSIADFWRIIAGLALFLYGMFHMEDAIKQIEGRRFKLFLRNYSKNKLQAILSGTLVTAILQSSSIVNLILLSFVGAGMITMRNAMSIVLGANIGGTFNSWLVAILGFKVGLSDYTLPILAVAGIGLILFKNKERLYQLSKFCMGFGLLFLGLEFIREGMDLMMKQFDFKPLLEYNHFVFLLVGFGITALIQTSAAMVVIVLSALNSGIIPIETAIVVVLGAELGTTVKIGIGAIGGNASKKRVALGNSLFNVFTSALGFMFLRHIVFLIENYFGFKDPIMILVAFQTFINVSGVIFFYFFMDAYSNFLEKRFKEGEKPFSSYLHQINPETTDSALITLEKEISLFIYNVMRLNMEVFQIRLIERDNEFEKQIGIANDSFSVNYETRYINLKKVEGEIISFYSRMGKDKLEAQDLIRLDQLMSATRNAMYAAKGIKDISHDKKELSNSGNDFKYEMYKLFREQLNDFYNELCAVFLKKNHHETLLKLVELMQRISSNYETASNTVYHNANKRQLKETDISTLFNINREIYSSCKAIVTSAKDLLLNREEAKVFDEKIEKKNN